MGAGVVKNVLPGQAREGNAWTLTSRLGWGDRSRREEAERPRAWVNSRQGHGSGCRSEHSPWCGEFIQCGSVVRQAYPPRPAC